jgi:hypothetical protein
MRSRKSVLGSQLGVISSKYAPDILQGVYTPAERPVVLKSAAFRYIRRRYPNFEKSNWS